MTAELAVPKRCPRRHSRQRNAVLMLGGVALDEGRVPVGPREHADAAVAVAD